MIELAVPDRPLSIVALGAHADDLEIGAGGLLSLLAATGRHHRVRWFVGAAEGVRAEEAERSAHRLVGDTMDLELAIHAFRERYFPYLSEVKAALDEMGAGEAADLVLAPRRDDRHQDHAALADLAWQTFRGPLILEYDIPKWDSDLGTANVFVPLDEAALERKVEHILSSFPSQAARAWFDADTFRSVARLRGIEAASATRFAEAFVARKVRLGIAGGVP